MFFFLFFMMPRFQLSARIQVQTDVYRIVVSGASATNVGSEALQSLLSYPTFKPDRLAVKTEAAGEYSTPPIDNRTKAQDIMNGAKFGIEVATGLLNIIRGRANNLTMKVDPVKDPDMYRACQLVFDNFAGKISFAMYERLLGRMRELYAGINRPSLEAQ
jgi:hypothetical protein